MYAERSGFDLSSFDYYRAFSWWKMACLVEGVADRPQAGAGGGLESSTGADSILERVDGLLENAVEAAGRL